MNDPGTTIPDSCFCDFNAGSAASAEVLACFLEVERACPANPASTHAPGRRARGVLEAARSRIGKVLDVAPDDVVFTSGGTEAANLAVSGLGDPSLPVQVSDAEHPAVLEPARQRGARLWPVDEAGVVQVAAPEEHVGLLCLVHAQSELGTLQPVVRTAELADDLQVPLFVDAAQTLGRTDLRPILATRAIVALSPHKAFGLRGHGVLVGLGLAGRLRPLLRGGGQEQGLRPGTQSPSLALANALAIEQAIATRELRAANMHAARATFLEALRSTAIVHQVLTPLANSVPNTAMVRFHDVDGRNLLPALDLAGIHASHGSACSAGAPTPPRILRAIGLADPVARGCVRFSFSSDHDLASVRRAGLRTGEVVRRLQKKK